MANNPNDPNNPNGQPGQNNDNTSNVSQGAQPTTTTQPGTPQPGASPTYSAPKQGSGFVNLQRVIGANTNNQLGNAVGQGVSNTAQDTQSNINQAQNDFTQQSQASNLNTDANRQYITNTYNTIQNQAVPGQPSTGSNSLDQSNAAADAYTPTGASTAGATNTPANNTGAVSSNAIQATPTSTTYTPSATDLSQFQQFISGQYQGPQNLANLNNLQNQATDVNNLGQFLNSNAGQQALLQRFVGNGQQYGTGEQRLDSLILGQTGAPQLAEARLATQGLPDLNNLSQADAATAQTYQNQAQDLANFTKTGATTVAGNINTALTNQVTQEQTAADQQYNTLENDIKAGALTSDDQSKIQSLLGIDPNAPIYNEAGGAAKLQSDLLSGITEAKYNNSNIANQQQYAAQQALQQLSGQTGAQLGLNLDQTQIGTASNSPLLADAAIKQELQNNQATASKDFTDAYAKAGILSQQELDYLNSADIQNQFKTIGAQLNAGDQDSANYLTAQDQATAEGQRLQQEFANFDKTNNLGGLAQYNSQLTDLADVGGTRSTNQGEGVSTFLQRIAAQEKTREDLQKQFGYNQNLSSLLAAANSGQTGPSAS